MEFEFRQRFHLLSEDRIDSEESRLHLPGNSSHLRLAAWRLDSPIKESPRLFLIGGPYSSLEAAEADGIRSRKAILLWALQRRLSIDLGDGRRRGGLTEAGVKWLEARIGAPVRDQLHGLDVYQRVDGQRFVATEAIPALRIEVGKALESLAEWYSRNPVMSPKQTLAAELYCAAGFDAPFRSRFLTLMTSLEALLDHQPRPQAVLAVVEELERTVADSKLLTAEKQSLMSSLAWLRTESIGQAGRRVAASLAAAKTYNGLAAGQYFSQCYELRSTIVHSGHVPDDVDLLAVTNELSRFVGDILRASIGVAAI